MPVLTMRDYKLKRKLKRLGILKKLEIEDMKGITKNGGVSIICGDGDIDVYSYHNKTVSQRPHCKSDFGGPLLLIPSFRGYDPCYAQGIIKNVKGGIKHKKTKTIFSYFHYPCAVAKEHKHTFKDVLRMMDESPEIFDRYGFKKRFTFFHVKRLNKNKEVEQNTYLVDMDLLRKFIKVGGLN